MRQAKLRTTQAAAPVRKRSRWLAVAHANSGVLFVLPAVLLFLVFGLYPVIYSFVLSFFRWNGFSGFSILPFACVAPTCSFVGFDNFKEFLFANPITAGMFRQAIWRDMFLLTTVTGGTIVLALPIALALNQGVRGQSLFRMLIMLPMVTAGIAVYYVWTFIYQPDGLLNSVLQMVGLGAIGAKQGWLGTSSLALPSVAVVLIWSSVPAAVIFYLAGLQTINAELYEAARLDGANSWHLLLHITWPLLLPITIIIVISTLNAIIQSSYQTIYLMTNGGPAGSTTTTGLMVFNYGFGDQRDLGVASAMAWMLFLALAVITMVNLRVFRSRT
ncbi:MAG: sugar ABC transporter permease [Roseiflexaceae bacterium]|nr:sugar ABC transporter permease [Roseiflexaceae bacterium]